MSQLIIAQFNDQFTASAAVEKLLSRGVRREQVATRLEESMRDTPLAEATPTTAIPPASREGDGATKKDGKLAQTRLPQYGVEPERFGRTVVTVAVGSDSAAEDIQQWLKAEGAVDLRSIEGELQVDGAHHSTGSETQSTAAAEADVQRAIDASRGGSALGSNRN